MSRIIILGVLGLILLYLYPNIHPHIAPLLNQTSTATSTIDVSATALAGLKQQVFEGGATKCPRIAIGYNANLDLIVKAKDLLQELNIQPAGSADHASVTSLSDFQELFSYYLSSGSAAERIVEDEETFQTIIQAATKLQHKTYSTGGNAALMANRLAAEKCDVLLGGAVGSTLSSLLHPAVKIVKDEATTEVKDEIHLIMEYPTGEAWGIHKAPRANRLIVTRDETNAKLAPLESFHKNLPEFDPSLVVVSGLHLLEGQAPADRQARISKMLSSINTIPDTDKEGNFVAVHLELASIGNRDFLKELADGVVPYVDSLGLNEQELGGVYLATGGTEYTADDFKSPKVKTVVAAIKHLYDHVRFTTKNAPNTHTQERETLSRVHFHCLHFHLIVQKKNAMWNQGLTSVAAGALACSTQACDNEGVDLLLPLEVEIAESRNITIQPSTPATKWREGDIEYFLSPVLVCRKALRTVGLGDAISAVGLVNHERKSRRVK